ncbi:hypothetical protein DsansV1_C08g0087141 [Dioscorea sansibarensis]
MGSCCSSELAETQLEKQNHQHANHQQHQPQRASFSLHHAPPPGAVGASPAAFAEFSLAELKAATGGFSSDNIVSESGEKAPNLVYKGWLQNRTWIAVKKFTRMAWPDPKQFAVGFAGGGLGRGEAEAPETGQLDWVLL